MADVLAYAEGCFTGSPGDQVGVELEFLVHDVSDPALTVPIARTTGALGGLTLPGKSVITYEPGGQVELSAPPGPLPAAVAALQEDVDRVRSALAAAGLTLGRSGLDGHRRPLRQLHTPRYDAMAACLGEPYGALMMCSTASIQVNLDFGADPFTRWRRAHLFGPALVAAFANSPGPVPWFGSWLSGRQAVWLALDPSRTAPVGAAHRAAGESGGQGHPAAAWADYLQTAKLMLVRETDGSCRQTAERHRFRDFRQAAGRPPTLDDLAYHATTLFPPVRPRGFMEIRYLDALGPVEWPVAVAVSYALIVDDDAAAAAAADASAVAGQWAEAARCGLAAPAFRQAAVAAFRAAADALPRWGAPPSLIDQVTDYAVRFVEPGRSPAADLLLETR
ncbi:ergothioneine biosynthesis glutamate--cysteine ligase EgtA [Herbidospora sp. NEAU-GS84]|uniref:Glutamate--cysteine ligase EgtA n=1 Tax=Herbidospora solisilvae TaxID=2696284 RepID=A0A7C9P1N3_9ACTN|nr:glutamate-cysteine ligase family protein [Herbidospora solisilvae]NAS24997.1 ergothioneine biosynthesis glutamate--cysteine ligase EgtA [Herbidospora solisilvae]